MVNVILLTVDSLRADHLGCYGYHRNTTPNIDKLASEGTVYTNAFAQAGNTACSFLSLIGGIYPIASDSFTDYEPFYPVHPDHFSTIATPFKGAGYRTLGFHTNPNLSTHCGYSKGFDLFSDGFRPSDDGSGGQADHRYGRKKKLRARIERKIAGTPLFPLATAVRDMMRPLNSLHVTADDMNTMALTELKKGEGDFFLWVHYMDVHVPYIPPRKDYVEVTGERIGQYRLNRLSRSMYDNLHHPDRIKRREELLGLYDAVILGLDRAVGSLVRQLKEADLYDDTIIAVTADHGDEFFEHGGVGHGLRFHDELLHVPLVIKGVGSGKDDRMFGLVDLPPTLAKAAGIDAASDFMGLPDAEGRKMVFSGSRHKGETIISIRTAKAKFIWNVTADMVEFFDLEKDPGEKVNIARKSKDAVETFREMANLHMQQVEEARIRAVVDSGLK